MEQTVLGLVTGHTSGSDLNFTQQEKEILRRLAGKVAELAVRPVEDQKRKLWFAHNELKTTRPVIFCDPENGWNEIITDEQMECSNEQARIWEMHLRKEIYWGESMGDDRVTEAVFPVNYTHVETDWGIADTKIGGDHGGSYTWIAPLKDYATDLKKMKFPEIIVDHEHTEKKKALAESIFGDLLKVQVKGAWWWTMGMTWTLIKLRGLEDFMTDFYLNPEGLHQVMAFLRDGHLNKLDFLEKNGLLSLNNDGTYVGSGGYGYTTELPQKDFSGKVRITDMWGFAESQETTSASPENFEEFIFPYQLPILEKFGLNCYGCCEPLDTRWHVVKKIPRLRRVSVSPWSDVEKMAEYLTDKYIYSRKPTPTDIAVPDPDWDRIRKELRSFIKKTKNNRVEIIMKDNHTIGKNPENVTTWCRIAREESEK
jgi:hypothetical protein